MPAESRTKKTLLNARVNLIFYFLTLLLSFFSRKIFLDCLGAEFIGLTGTLQNLLGFLNLAELGIGTAIGYVLYKPLFDHDQEKINEIISVMGYLYRWIGLIILGAGCILACFLPLIFPSTGFPLALIYFAYFSFLASSLIGYFINYRQNLLGADQRNYVVTGYYQTMTIVKTIIQMALAYYTRSYFLWVAIELTFGIIYSFVLNWRINVTYPWLRAEIKLGKTLFKKYPEVMNKTKQLFAHKLGSFFQFQIMPILVYSFSSLTMVALYQNYTLITTKVGGFFSNVFAGMGASVGNLVAEGNQKKIMSVFGELLSLRFFLSGVIVIPTFLLMDSFINLWLGQEFVLSKYTLILILLPVFMTNINDTIYEFKFAYGLFWDVWVPLIRIVIILCVSIPLGILYGLNGILIGPIVSLFVVVFLWNPYMLYHWGFKIHIYKYWLVFFKNISCILVGAVVSYFFMNQFNGIDVHNFFEWSLIAIPVSLVYVILSYITFCLFTDGMNNLNLRILSFFRRFHKQS